MALPDTVRRIFLLASVLIPLSLAETVFAQHGRPCGTPAPPSVGLALGRSSPYVEDLVRGDVGLPATGTVDVDSGVQFVGRVDLPVAGPVRARVEAGRANWPVHLVASASGAKAQDASAGSVSVRHVDAFVGLRTGRPPACAHVSVGGGLYSFSFKGAAFVRPGTALAAGIEIPAGEHGALQVDAVVHAIETHGHGFIRMSGILVFNVVVGWAYRF